MNLAAWLADWRRWRLALALGLIGGALFWEMTMPLAWLLGAMAATTIAALLGARPAVPRRLNLGTQAILGLVLGCAFGSDFVAQVGRWSISLVTMCAYVAVTTYLVMRWYRRLGMGPTTAYFSSAPGGLNLMAAVGGALGGDDRVISLVHAVRILLVVASIPVWYRITGAYVPAKVMDVSARLADLRGIDAAVLAGCAVAGLALGRAIRLPAFWLTGPMLLSAALHVAGLSQVRPPIELVYLAQLVTGSAMGSRFVGTKARHLLLPVTASVTGTAAMLAGAFACARILAVATGLSPDAMLLSFAPGGLAEMSLVALALGVDVAFVSTHHFVRVVLVVMLVPLIQRMAARAAGQDGALPTASATEPNPSA